MYGSRSSASGRTNCRWAFTHWYIEGGYARYQMPAAVAEILRPLRDVPRP